MNGSPGRHLPHLCCICPPEHGTLPPTLSRFLSRNLYPPAGPKLLTDWGPTPDRWFRSGQEHKKTSLERLAEEFPPNIKWLLVGDDGQHDESIYSEFAQRHPANVRAIAIRQLSAGEAVLAGGRSKSGGQPTPGIPWIYAPGWSGNVGPTRRTGRHPE